MARIARSRIRVPSEPVEKPLETGSDDETRAKARERTLAKPIADELPELAARFREARRAGKRMIMLPIDADIVEAFMETGEGWSDRIEAALRSALGRKGKG